MEALIRSRRALKGRVTRVENAIHINDPEADVIEKGQAIITLDQCSKIEDDLTSLQAKIIQTSDEAEFDQHENEFNQLADRIDKLKITLQKVKMTAESERLLNTSNSESENRSQPVAKIQLPKLDLPTFNGNPQDWISFHDLFLAMVHGNKSLKNSQKLQYLKLALKGEASHILQSVQVTDDNYDEAWEILTKRYQNLRQIVYSHLNRIVSQPALTIESATGLRKLMDTTMEYVRALRVLKYPIDDGPWSVYIVTQKLDNESKREWTLSLKDDKIPEFKDFIEFMEQRANALYESSTKAKASSKPATSDAKQGKFQKPFNESKSCYTTEVKPFNKKLSRCNQCNGDHRLFGCKQFRNSSLDDKWKLIKQKNLCSNCLGSGHRKDNCPSQKVCVKCNKAHNTLLHWDRKDSGPTSTVETSTSFKSVHARPEPGPEIKSHAGFTQGLLSTALIKVEDVTGQQQYVRVFLNGGSQESFITESLATRLAIKRQHASFSINGLGQTSAGSVKGKVNCALFSRTDSKFSISIEAFVVPKLTGDVPNFHIDTAQFQTFIQDLNLADPDFARPGKVEMLIGAPDLLYIIQDGIRLGKQGVPHAQNSRFGWLLSGKVNATQPPTVNSTTAIISLHNQVDSDTQLRKFWEIEEIHSPRSIMSTEDKECESHFNSTTTRDDNGTFIVQFPFKESPEFGESRQTAISRFHQVERKIHRDPNLLQQYSAFMDEYASLGHMSPITSAMVRSKSISTYYLPHHAVLKPNSSTTKLRVVFDASCKSANGQSLNDNLMVGPRLQDDLTDILLRFRTHKVAFTADIEKMYRQIRIHPDQRDYQRILWRKSPQDPIQEFQLNTVTYGTASAPYQAVKCLQTLAKEEYQHFPQAAEVLQRDFYMDDTMTGEESTEKALQLMTQVRQLCSKGNFLLRKFASNDPILLDTLSPDLKETQDLHIEFDESIGTLGLRWHPASDTFSFAVNISVLKDGPVTKRRLLSDVARIFDPLGWLAPVVISCKILFQQLWKENLDWDEPLHKSIEDEWLYIRQNLFTIREISIPRWLQTIGQARQYDVHGFCDASQSAYAAVVFLRVTDAQGYSSVTLVTSKTKVAPIKTISIPRLELCGAVLLSKLVVNVKRALRLPINSTVAWTDSTIVLAWLKDRPDRWKTFVANRTSEIQDSIPYPSWGHVSSEDNPADCASRGISPLELQNHQLWWHGPAWLASEAIYWPSNQFEETTIEERKKSIIATTSTEDSATPKIDFFNLFSSYRKLKRALAYWLRFICNLRKSKSTQDFAPLTAAELQIAQCRLIRLVQKHEFQDELKILSTKQELRKGNRLKPLNPFIDENGILRVGGRLTASPIPRSQKHPILLPQKHQLTKLIVRDQHVRNLHAGPRLLLSTLQQQYWILGGMNAVRQVTHHCVECLRQQARTAQQYMGDLPRARTELIHPFFRTGIDYAGPVTLRHGSRRSKQFSKCYISFFVCMATKAIHLELVSDLTSAAFIAALKRFIARRGKCAEIFSDNGTNFVGANRELKELYDLVTSNLHNDAITKFLSNDGITWNFNPPSAPHQGGLWEAAVKSAKFHLKRVIGSFIYNFEEYGTLLCQIEACLNSRPLCTLPGSPGELDVLTPEHFLIGNPINAIPDPDILLIPENRLDYWQRIQQRIQDFWRRWQAEYLVTLQKRTKWTTEHQNIKTGDIVIVKDENSPPTKWPIARVIETYPGKDGKVRQVLLKSASGIHRRPIVKLCPLPID